MTQTTTQRRLMRTAAAFNSKARRLGAPGRVSAEDLIRIWSAQKGICYYCPTDLDPLYATFDHRLPFERGGTNTIENLVLSCLTDNRQKFTMTEAEYRDWLGLERICPVDQTKFRPRPADYRRGLGFYCSRKCSGTAGGRVTSAPSPRAQPSPARQPRPGL